MGRLCGESGGKGGREGCGEGDGKGGGEGAVGGCGLANAAARHVMCVAEAVARHVALLHLVPKRDVLCSNDRGAHIGFTWCFIHFLLDRKCPASRGFSSLSMQIR